MNKDWFLKTINNNFVKDLIYVSFGMMPSTIFSFIFMILIARFLGPSDYGCYILVQSISAFLIIPMLMGLHNSTVKYLSSKTTSIDISKIISTSFLLVLGSSLVFVTFFYYFNNYLQIIFSTSSNIIFLSIIYSLCTAMYTITISALKGLYNMKKFSIYQLINLTILIILYTIIYITNNISVGSLICSVSLSYVLISIIIIIDIKNYIHLTIDNSSLKDLTSYGAINFIGNVSYTIYLNIDKIILNKYLTTSDLGLYAAYSLISVNLLNVFTGVFITVFFPFASRATNKDFIYKNLNRALPMIYMFGIIIITIVEYIIIKLYGSLYNFDFTIALLFSIASVSVCVFNIYSWLINSIGINGIKITTLSQIIIAIMCLPLNFLLVPILSIKGPIITIIISQSIGIVVINYYLSKYINNTNT